VGDVCGHHFDVHGNEASPDFDARVVAIGREDLLAISTRIGVASGPGKAEAILGAARSGLVNALVTDSVTASTVLALSG
jgi:DNA-binding transcriptional regulator LsrR (DeoR family)